ncbi:MAG: PepSY-associated TM helix domain-containing protein [Gammaproteobacteria bacterium]|jgi:uncharacterized iron-regulated membrane protein
MIRKLFFWAHLTCGVVAGLVVLMMSATGVILTYERQILAWQESRAYSYEPESGQQRLPLESLLASAETEDFEASSVILNRDPAAPVILSAGRSGRLHLNPYTGTVHESVDDRLDRFFSAVTGWHRWFNVTGEGRSTARAVTGAANLLFLFLVLSGIYLWLPGIIRWATLRGRLWFHPNARSGQARDFNWHHVFGIWSAIPLAVIVATATVFNYSWANNLVYRLAGEEPPQRRSGSSPQPANQAAVSATAPSQSLDALFARVRESEYVGDWRAITITLPAAGADTVSFSIDQGSGGEPQKRHTLSLDRASGQVVAWQPFTSQSPGRQARSWVRFLHTGEALGLPGQTVAGLVSFFAVLMVWTGLALSLRRFLRFLRRVRERRNKSEDGNTTYA